MQLPKLCLLLGWAGAHAGAVPWQVNKRQLGACIPKIKESDAGWSFCSCSPSCCCCIYCTYLSCCFWICPQQNLPTKTMPLCPGKTSISARTGTKWWSPMNRSGPSALARWPHLTRTGPRCFVKRNGMKIYLPKYVDLKKVWNIVGFTYRDSYIKYG